VGLGESFFGSDTAMSGGKGKDREGLKFVIAGTRNIDVMRKKDRGTEERDSRITVS